MTAILLAVPGSFAQRGGAANPELIARYTRRFKLDTNLFFNSFEELLAKTNVPNLKEQAELIDTARQAETGPDQAQAITAYELVCATYPDTKAAELSQLRMTQLQMSKKAAARIWKSKVGQFSVTATLVAFDGKSAQLQTADGKTITVALDALSTKISSSSRKRSRKTRNVSNCWDSGVNRGCSGPGFNDRCAAE